MGLNRQLTGVPWHTERMHRAEDDFRRHKRRCIHFIPKNGQCQCINGKCFGSAHCPDYKEKPEETMHKDNSCQRDKKNKSLSKEEKKLKGKISVKGTKVVHKKFGEGTVVKSEGRKTTIKFDDNKAIKFDIDMCIIAGLISIKD